MSGGFNFPILVGSGGSCRLTAKNMKTGVVISRRTGDDGDLQKGRNTSFFNCTTNDKVYELFGHTQRFTGITGGYYDQTLAGWYDKDGVATTEALAKPNDIIIDWSTHEESTGDFMMIHAVEDGLFTLTQAFTYVNSLTIGGFSDWRLPNIVEGLSLYNHSMLRYHLNYEPFMFGYTGYYWTSTEHAGDLAQALYPYNALGGYNVLISTLTSSARKAFAVRTGNISEL